MPVSERHRDEIFRTLTMLRGGFLELGEVDGEPCVPMAAEGSIQVPEGTRGLFLRLRVPRPALNGDLIVLRFLAGNGRPLGEARLGHEDAWISLDPGGQTEVRLQVDRTWPGDLVGLPADRRLGLLVMDAEILAAELRSSYDLVSADAGGRRFLSLRLDVTNKCNLRCRMCPLSFDEIFYQPKSYVGVSEFERFAAAVLPRVEQLSLSVAYEPLLHPGFSDILEIVNRHGVPFVEFTTNGTLLNERLVNAFIDHGVSRVTFSVDGAVAGTYERIRRGASFDAFLRGLEIFGRVRRQRRAAHPELSFNMVLMKSNVDELPDVMRLGGAHGLDVMHSCLLIPHVGLQMEEEALQHHRERANRAFRQARAVARELGLRASIPEDFNLALPEEKVESLPVTPEYTLAEDWDRKRPRSYTLTSQDEVGESEFEETLPAVEPAHVPSERPEGVPSDPVWKTLAALPGPESLATPLKPKVYGEIERPTMVRSGHASAGAEALDGDGTRVRAACIYPWTLAIVNPDLRIVPCCNWSDYSTMGDLRESSFEDVWNGDAYRRLRLELQTGRYRPCCEHCPERREI